MEDALKLAKTKEGREEIFIIGGEQIYRQAMPLLDKIYLTRVHAKIDGDKFFKYNRKQWRETSRQSHPADDKNKYAFDFLVLERK